MRIAKNIFDFMKKETVLAAAAFLALLSAFIVKPSAAYVEYIDFRVLGILLSLMIVMAGFQKNGLFDTIARVLLKRTRSTRELCLVLVFLCFFFSMLITNDVALITFVPFTILILRTSQKENLLIPVIAIQTIAANLGSMLTPVGNPQNLYLYNLGGFSLSAFIKIMLPYSLLSLAGLFIWTMAICHKNERISIEQESGAAQTENGGRKEAFRNAAYMFLFFLSILAVVKVIPYYIVLFFVVLITLAMDRRVLKTIDYSLLFTFCFFFIFTGNIGQLDLAKQWLQSAVSGRAVLMGTVVSQIISNVPAALLLSGFTSDYKSLLIGVNIGGLGTLIASMASLISYKLYVHDYNQNKGKYFAYFTVSNLCFLALLSMGAYILS